MFLNKRSYIFITKQRHKNKENSHHFSHKACPTIQIVVAVSVWYVKIIMNLIQHKYMSHSSLSHRGSSLMSPLELYLIIQLLYKSMGEWMGQFCFSFMARNCLILKVLWKDMAREEADRTCHDGRDRERCPIFFWQVTINLEIQCPGFLIEMKNGWILVS